MQFPLQLTKELHGKGYQIIAACRKTSKDLSSVPSVHVVEGNPCSLDAIFRHKHLTNGKCALRHTAVPSKVLY